MRERINRTGAYTSDENHLSFSCHGRGNATRVNRGAAPDVSSAGGVTENGGIMDKYLSRRSFLVTGAAAIAGWTIYRSLPATRVEAGGKAASPHEVVIVEFSDQGQNEGRKTLPTVVKTDAEWKQLLSRESYEVTRHAGTERAYSGQYWDLHDKGLYRCICCDTALFSSDTKFDSHTGWPSFWQPLAKENVREILDMSLGMQRTAVSCKLCEAHLGHVFDDGPRPTGLRYCMNSVSLKFAKLA
jgi:peptide-methionine (R)-S-oxide reductase